MAYTASIVRDAENEVFVIQRLDSDGNPDPAEPIVRLKMADLDDIIEAIPAHTVLDIQFREWDVCEGQYAVFLSSQAYTKT